MSYSIKSNASWGTLVPIEGSINHREPIFLNQQIVTFGHSSQNTHVESDAWISKIHFAIQLGQQVQPAVSDIIWRPQPHMVLWYMAVGANGCFVNGKKKRTSDVGVISDGDIIHFFKSEGEFLAFRFESGIAERGVSVV